MTKRNVTSGSSRSRLVAAAFALGALAPAARAAAADYWVGPNGNDGASGQEGAPWRTLQKAIESVRAGDTVTVMDGTYGGFACRSKAGRADARITVRAQNRHAAKIDRAGAGADAQDFVQLNSCSYVTIDGFEVSGAPRSGIAVLGNTTTGADARGVVIQNNRALRNGRSVRGRHDGVFTGFALDVTIQDNDIRDSAEHGIYVSNAADNPIIRRNVVTGTGGNCLQINADQSTGGDGRISNWTIEGNTLRDCRGSAGINLDGAVEGTLRNNLIYDCAKAGITMFRIDGAVASRGNLVVNNTVFCPAGSRAALQLADGANDNVVFNNIFYARAPGIEMQAVAGVQHDFNLVSSISGGKLGANEASPSPEAIFVDVGKRDLRLAARSPARNSGIGALAGKTGAAVDHEGVTRPSGVAVDRGCYEADEGSGDSAAPTAAPVGAPPPAAPLPPTMSATTMPLTAPGGAGAGSPGAPAEGPIAAPVRADAGPAQAPTAPPSPAPRADGGLGEAGGPEGLPADPVGPAAEATGCSYGRGASGGAGALAWFVAVCAGLACSRRRTRG
jgi:parallel beta-helix repeat protein